MIAIGGTNELAERSEDEAMEEVSANRIALFDEDMELKTEILVFVR